MVAVIILAGQRADEVDMLCVNAGVSQKADIKICGQSMLERVCAALRAADIAYPYFLSGYDGEYQEGLKPTASGCGPATSAHVALTDIDTYPVLITTCDNALLTADMITSFIAKSKESGGDICVGLATQEIIEAAYPDVKRTYLRFKNVAVSGCNLFYLSNAAGLRAIDMWQTAQKDRKRPLRLALRMGVPALISYALGRLSLEGAFLYGSKRLGISIKPICLPFAEAAIDVDKPADLELASYILERRERDLVS